MCDINRWTIFSLLNPEFVSSIKFAIVFGNAANEALIVTDSDQVYGIGTNTCSCLGSARGIGIGNGHSSLDPACIESLSNRQIVSISFGSGPHVLALTESGEIFAWGHNGYGQIGNGTTQPGLSPSLLIGALTDVTVVQVCCGNQHSVCVSDNGELFAWGQNSCGQIGIGSTVNQPAPKKVAGHLANRFVKSVSCGQNSTVALTSGGELFAWGYNGNGQLGIGSTTNQTQPCKILELQNVVISQVQCGFAHVLALTDQGELYAWGSNSCGQLCMLSRGNQLIPLKTALAIGRISEMAAAHACNISVVMNQSGKVFMWGQVRGQSVSQPQETRFTNVDEVFACFANPAISFRPINFFSARDDSIQESIRAAFDDPSSCDVRFQVDGKVIHAHKAILKIRCQHFRSMLHEAWTRGNEESVDISQFSYTVYRAFISYLYTDRVDLSPEDAIGLLDLATSYCEESLKEKCVEIIRRGITVSNAVFLYAAALRFDSKDLEQFCFHFCFHHMTDVTLSDGLQRLDEASVKHFLVQAAKSGAFKH